MKPAGRSEDVFAVLPKQWATVLQDAALISQEWMSFWNTQWQNWIEVAMTIQGLDKAKPIQTLVGKTISMPEEQVTRVDIRSPLPWVQSFSWLLAKTAEKQQEKSAAVQPVTVKKATAAKPAVKKTATKAVKTIPVAKPAAAKSATAKTKTPAVKTSATKPVVAKKPAANKSKPKS